MRPALSLLGGLLLLACGPKNTEPAEGGSDVAPAAEDAGPAPVAEDAGPAPAAAGAPEADDAVAEAGAEAPAGEPHRAAPTKGELTCPGITSGLDTWLRGGAHKVVVDAEGRASVVVALESAETDLPESFAESSRRPSEAVGNVAYGHVASSELCALAATEGVKGVRAADAASPK